MRKSEFQGCMKVLVTNQNIKYFSGSEINAVQICEALKARGIEAEIGTFIHGAPLSEIAAQKGIRVFNLLEDNDRLLEYDLVWAHHTPTLAALIFNKKISDTKIIFSSLSPIVPIECVPVFHHDIHYFLSHSRGNSAVMIRDGIPAEKIHYFPNYAPSGYFSKARIKHNAIIRKIAVISNHVPEELRGFAAIARKKGIQVDFFGIEDRQAYVDDNLLLRYDLVISIGKTVQYCFGLKIPVYIYDHFGGPGYLNATNFEFAERFNFSGRNSGIKKSSEELYSDILSGFSLNLECLEDLYEKCCQEFDLDKNLDRLLGDLEELPVTNIEQFRARNTLSERVYAAYLDLLRENLRLNQVVEENSQEIDRTISAYTSTVSWKITKPLRKMRVMFLKKKTPGSATR